MFSKKKKPSLEDEITRFATALQLEAGNEMNDLRRRRTSDELIYNLTMYMFGFCLTFFREMSIQPEIRAETIETVMDQLIGEVAALHSQAMYDNPEVAEKVFRNNITTQISQFGDMTGEERLAYYKKLLAATAEDFGLSVGDDVIDASVSRWMAMYMSADPHSLLDVMKR